MTKTLVPRIPESGAPARPPLSLTPRIALAAALGAIVLSALFGLAFAPVQLPATAKVAAAHYSVQMANYAFAPASITVNEGDTITWTNQDAAPHTVTTTSGPQSLNSPYLSKGQSWSYTFSVPGTYEYYCTVHPDMRARVVVRAPAPATTAPRTQSSYAAKPPAAALPPAHATQPPTTAASASSAAALAPGADPSASAAAASQLQAQVTSSTSGINTLSPVLLLGGLAATIAVFCLLLVGSRATPAPAPAEPAPTEPPHDGLDDYDD
jgi:amicyanin